MGYAGMIIENTVIFTEEVVCVLEYTSEMLFILCYVVAVVRLG